MSTSTIGAIPQTLAEVIGQDLAGFEVREAFFLELDHTLMGTFPARLSDLARGQREAEILCVDRELLARVETLLLPRPSKVTAIFVLYSREGGFAFQLNHPSYTRSKDKGNVPVLWIMDETEFLRFAEVEGSFEWTPGLVSFR